MYLVLKMSPILKPRFTTIQHSQLKVCPAGWFTTATSRLCLKLIHTPENWTDARIKCQAENADLVIKIDQEKQNFMFGNFSIHVNIYAITHIMGQYLILS